MKSIFVLLLTGCWSISIYFPNGEEEEESCQVGDTFYDLHVKLKNKGRIPPSLVGFFVTLGSNSQPIGMETLCDTFDAASIVLQSPLMDIDPYRGTNTLQQISNFHPADNPPLRLNYADETRIFRKLEMIYGLENLHVETRRELEEFERKFRRYSEGDTESPYHLRNAGLGCCLFL